MDDAQRRYVVVGAGAVGGTIGGLLHAAGRDVVLVARGAHLEAMRRDGLRLVTSGGEHVLPVPVAAGPDELQLTTNDVLVIATKSQDAPDALGQWAWAPVRTPDGERPAGAVVPLLCAQNGVSNEPAALRWFARVAGVCVWLPSSLPAPGTVLASGAPLPAVLHLGWVHGSASPDDAALLAAVASDLEAAGTRAPVRDDVMAWKRAKLLSNLGNALDALVGPEALTGPAAAPLLDAARQEALAVFAAAGLEVAPDEVDSGLRDLVRAVDLPGFSRSGSSTFQSLERSAGSVETDHLNGEVVRLGRSHSVTTPVNAALQALAAQAVRRGSGPRSLTVGDVADAARRHSSA